MAAAASWITCTGDLLLSTGGPPDAPALPHAEASVALRSAAITIPIRRCSRWLEVPGMATPPIDWTRMVGNPHSHEDRPATTRVARL
jgi:hypothetical protein